MSGELSVPSDETLLGYILGGLCDQENALIEELLTHNKAVQVRVRDLRSMLEPLANEAFSDPSGESTDSDIDVLPPINLIGATMAAIQAQAAELANVPASENGARPESFSRLASDSYDAQSHSNRVAWFDSLVTLVAGIVVLSLVLPGILRWRESARQQECAENLRNLGSALGSFALFQPSHRLPEIEPSGPLAFAGIYSIRLRDNQLLDNSRWLQCPNDDSGSLLASIPTSKQFLDAPESKRFVWRMLAGGDYAYNMGSVVQGKYQAPSIESPARVAWIGDTWPVDLQAPLSDEDFQLHGSRGLNVLYSDGSVQWFRLPKLQELSSIDHPYLNTEFKQAPGIGEADACLGPSHFLPAVRSNLPY